MPLNTIFSIPIKPTGQCKNILHVEKEDFLCKGTGYTG
jgi:hypothetical protein